MPRTLPYVLTPQDLVTTREARREGFLTIAMRRFEEECVMFIHDGKCYAESPEPVLKVTSFEVCSPHKMKVVFNDGAVRIFDGRSLLKGEAFAALADERVFSDCKLDYETLTWLDGALDVAPEYVREHSVPLTEPQ